MSKTPSVPGTDRPAEKAAGHWLLAQLGKKVLRPLVCSASAAWVLSI